MELLELLKKLNYIVKAYSRKDQPSHEGISDPDSCLNREEKDCFKI